MKKTIVMVLAFALVLGVAIGGTLAWLQDITDPVVNTFTEGKVDIDLYETEGSKKVLAKEYKMVPGDVLTKDPTVEVLAVSEACWLFVKIEEINNVDTFLSYAIADGWNVLSGTVDNAESPTDGDETIVIYRAVGDTDSDQTFAVLKDNQVTVNTAVGMTEMNDLGTSYPQLKFTAYAIQSANITDTNSNGTAADEAWAALKP